MDTKDSININQTNSSKYVGYLTSIEGSWLIWNDDIEIIKEQWCFGLAIFETNGLTKEKLKDIFPILPERGIILQYFSENLKFVYQVGTIIGLDHPVRKVLSEKNKNK